MEIGYVLQHYQNHISPNYLQNKVKELERIGFNSVWLTDHVLMPQQSRLPKYNMITEAITSLAHLSAIADHINFGFSTIVLPQRNPIVIAKQLATIHFFIQNRLNISFGAGWCEEEFQFLNKEFTNRGERFDEYLQVIDTMFQGKTNFSGKYFQFDESVFQPRAEGLDELPLYIAGNSKYALQRAIKYGDGWHPVNLSPEEITKLLDKYNISNLDTILRLGIKKSEISESIDSIVSAYNDIGVTELIIDDYNNIEIFEEISGFLSN